VHVTDPSTVIFRIC